LALKGEDYQPKINTPQMTNVPMGQVEQESDPKGNKGDQNKNKDISILACICRPK
jgi:hypothetical protein